MMTGRPFKVLRGLSFYIAVIGLVLIFIFPSLWILSTSLKYPVEYYTYPPIWIPSQVTLDNYRLMFMEYQVGAVVANSLLIALANTTVVLMLAVPAAYAIGRYRLGGDHLSFWIISQRMLPAVAIVIPMFLVARSLGLTNTYHGLLLAYSLFLTPFAIWLLIGFFKEFPYDIQDAAEIDGCSELGSLVRIVLPLLSGGIFVVALLVFVFTWNDLLIAIVLTRAETRTIMAFFTAVLTAPTGENYGVAAGSVVIGLIPAYLFALFGQQYLTRGLTMGGVKG
ncbi:MAG: carbohydrate ABC transporter permease [Chloroflexi bacterium]|nr:carbohydrate ABC transporter permease [Chloroflexota bacterium]